MPFTARRLVNSDFEVVMEPNTLRGARPNVERRFAYCTHENDAQVVAAALNLTEKLCQLRDHPRANPTLGISIVPNSAVPENEIWISTESGRMQKVYFEKEAQ